MNLLDDPALIADGLIALATLASAAWVAWRVFRAWKRPPTAAGPDGHALSPLGAALDPFRAVDDPAYATLRPEQVAAVQRQAGFNLAINVANAIILAAVVAGTANPVVLLAWLCVVVWVVSRGLRQWRRNRRRPVPAAVSKRTLRRMTYHAAVLGLLWGGGFAIFYGEANAVGRVVLVALGMGMAAGGTVAMAASPGAAATFAACVLVPGILRLVTTGHPGDPTLATLCILYGCSMTATLTEVYDSFARNVLARAAQREQAETIALLLNTYEEHASGWLWKADRAGFLLESPPRLERLLGVAPGSLFGRPLWAIEDDKQASRAGWNDLIRDLREGRAFRDRVVAARRDSDGGTVWLSLSGRQLQDGAWRGAGTDVTAREIAVRALTAAQTVAPTVARAGDAPADPPTPSALGSESGEAVAGSSRSAGGSS